MQKSEAKKNAAQNAMQREAAANVLDVFEKKGNSRAQVHMACGTGKTRVGVRVMKGLRAKITIVLCPSLELVKQNVDTYLKTARRKFSVLVVCSDDAAVTEAREQYEIDAPTTTDVKEIRDVLKSARGPVVVFGTYQSSDRIADATRLARPVIETDLIVFDEAHHTAGVSKEERQFSIALYDKNIRAKKRLFMTATPRIYFRTRNRDQEFRVQCMDDETLYGRVAHRVDMEEAIRRGVIVDYKVVVCNPVESLEELMKESESVELTTRCAAVLLAMNGLSKDRRKIRKIFTYSANIARARAFVQECERVHAYFYKTGVIDRPLWIRTIEGIMSGRERREILDEFEQRKSGINIIANCKVLGEGVDAPEVDGIAFVDPKDSGREIIQAIGRCTRLYPGKTYGRVIVPVFLPEDESGRKTSFDGVIRIVDELRNRDSRIERTAMSNAFAREQGEQQAVWQFESEQIVFEGLSELHLSEIRPRIRESVDYFTYSKEAIAEAAREYFEKHGKRPTARVSRLWGNAHCYLKRAHSSTLRKVLDEYGIGDPLMVYRGDMSESEMRDRAIEFHEKHGRWPRVTDVEGKWCALSGRLRTRGSSLYKWLIEQGLAEEKCVPSESEMRERAIAFREEHGRWPTYNDVEGGWCAFNRRLRGCGSSLPQWFVEQGLKKAKRIPSESEMRERAIAFREEHGRWPTCNDIEGGWCAFSQRLIARESSLSKWFIEHGLKEEKRVPSEPEMRDRAIAFREEHGRWPTCHDIEGGWKALDFRFRKRGSSLSKWLIEQGLKKAKHIPSETEMRERAIEFRKEHGRWPRVIDVEGGWCAFNGRLNKRGSSLAQWKRENNFVD